MKITEISGTVNGYPVQKARLLFIPQCFVNMSAKAEARFTLEEARDDRNYLTGCELELFFCRKTCLWGVAAKFHHEFR